MEPSGIDIDWVALIGSWVLGWGLLLAPPYLGFALLPGPAVVAVTLSALFVWHARWKRRNLLQD